MVKYISCGRINKYYGYIFLSVFFTLLKDFAFGVNYNNSFKELYIFNLSNEHVIIHALFGYLLVFFSSLTIYKCKIKKRKNILIKESENVQEQKEEKLSKKHLTTLLFIIILWVLEEQLKQIYMDTLKNLDIWMLELIIIYYFMKKTFNVKLYKHQILSFIIIIFPFIFKIVTIILSCINPDINDPGIIYLNNKYIIPIGIILYIILLISDSYILTKIKLFIDTRFISISEVLMYFGLFGSIYCIIITIVSTHIECHLFIDNICEIKTKDNNNNSTIYYYENYKIYFNGLKERENLIKEILANFVNDISFLLKYFFSLQVVKLLSPIHNIFSIPVFFFFQKTLLAIITLCIEHNLFIKNKIKYILWKFILDISGDLLSILGLMIYLEIIELNFCNFDYDIKKSIFIRATEDLLFDSKEKDFIFLENGDVEEVSIESKKNKKSKSIEFKINNK